MHRRQFLESVAASTMTALVPPDIAAAGRSFGIAYTSYVVRLAQGRDIFKMTGASLPAATFLNLCARAGAAGVQMDLTQLDATTASALAAVRQQAETLGLFIELSAPPGSLASAEAYSEVARIARGVGASRLRMALLSGRRYETFESMAAWRVFADRWTRGLPAIAPAIDRERLQVGIENHKDWLAVELAGILRGIGSEYLGACVDFGNNLSLLEDPMATVEALAPYAVTTHLKDMAVRVDGEGFELSEVPLGEGVLPVPRMIETIRRARPDVHFCLEMITRDPLAVPYKRDAYWVAFETKDAPAVAAFERGILAKARRDLPRTSGLTAEAAVALEDEHVRRCAVHAKDVLKL